MSNPAAQAPPSVTFDSVYHVLQHTLLSPVFSAGIGLFVYHNQKHSLTSDHLSLYYAAAYFSICWLTWFVPFSSRVWRNKSWQYGWRGLAGVHRLDWNDQIVLITGGSQGLGKAVVDILDTKKVTVVVLDRILPDSGAPEYNDVHFYQCDVSDHLQVAKVAETIRKEIGAPTVIVNNAGVVSGRPLLDLSEQDLIRTFNVNVLSPFFVIKTFLPDMLRARRGHIVNISSLLGQIGVAGLTDYCASKSALIGLHDSLQAELQRSPKTTNVRVSLILPSFIRTSLFATVKPFSPLNAFLFPILEPYQVANAIVEQIEREESGVVALPVLVSLAWLWRGLPSWARDFVKWFSDADAAMDAFHKKD